MGKLPKLPEVHIHLPDEDLKFEMYSSPRKGDFYIRKGKSYKVKFVSWSGTEAHVWCVRKDPKR
jgi:hypothetical protein